jgi:hypothetical protein
LPIPAKEVQSKFQLWDVWKEKAYQETKISLSLPTFQVNIAVGKPLLTGFYYGKLLIVPNEQLPEMHNIFSKEFSWWLPFRVGEVKEITPWIEKNLKSLHTISQDIRRQYEELQKISQEPFPKLKSQWPSFSAKWQRKHSQLAKWKSAQEEYLIPFCASLENSLLELLKQLKKLHTEVELFVQEVSLIPPDAIKTENYLKAELRFHEMLREKKESFAGKKNY